MMKFIVDPIFRVNIFYCNAPTSEQYRKEFKRLNGIETDCDDDMGGRFEGLWVPGEAIERAIMWVPNDQPDILSHEAFHATQWILQDRRSTPLTDSTAELYAYYQQYIVKECLATQVDTRIKIRRDLDAHITPKKKRRRRKKS